MTLQYRFSSSSTPVNPRLAIATTLRNADDVLDSFIHYHQAIGFDHLFLFFDDPEELARSNVQGYDRVTAIAHDTDLRQRWSTSTLPALWYAQAEVMARQTLNLEVAIDLARQHHIDWLLHIDHDELFYVPGGAAKAHFASLTARNIQGMTYLNHEAVPEQVDILDFFKVATLFKKAGPAPGEKLAFNPQQLALINTTPQLPSRFFHFYVNGKSAAFVRGGLQPGGVHTFRLPEGELVAGGYEDPVILHYPCCGFDHFWNKFITLERVYARGLETWWGQDITDIVGKFYLEARDIVRRRDQQAARDCYRNRYVISDQTHIATLIENGLCFRISEPSELLMAFP
ncbi:glycosyltransferase family 2 protein [Candidatus Entotheonella palauensis]|uniref:Glycosyl transferase family 2 n=1 Tax=Candidatus Entotheonella gemina TaxID=1429439 RepID=W4MBM3_9BACT|nr:glycosyltransferase family 2 protein [Candidatus Entotheonella palauensis]ETX07276.1 MAG: hypothetical protein ETSY2_12110 [Candidatus Entotheonella gemina]